MIERILLDLDDVLNEFTVHAMRHVGCYMPGGWRDYNPAYGFNIVAAAGDILLKQCPSNMAFCGLSSNEFWEQIDEDFWASVPKSKLFDDIMSFAFDWVCEKSVFVVTAPIRDRDGFVSEDCVNGKIRWFNEHVPLCSSQLIIAQSKWALATPENLLVDDCDKNVDAFRRRGGKAVLFPRPWNTLHEFSHCPMKFVDSVAEASL